MKNIYAFLAGFFLLFAVNGQNISFSPDIYSGCVPVVVNFTNTSSIDTTGVNFFWDFGDGTGQFQGFEISHYYQYSNWYHITLWAIDSVGNMLGYDYTNIDLKGSKGEFYLSTGNDVCPGQNINFSSRNDYWQVNWDMGDGTGVYYSNDLNYSFADPGTYYVTMIAEGSCGIDTIIQAVNVSEDAIPAVSASTASGGQSCPGDEIQFYANYDTDQYFWIFGDGSYSTLMNPMHAFATVGTYEVTLFATNNCGNSNSYTFNIEINDSSMASAWMNAWPQYSCPQQDIYFSTQASGSVEWDMGDGTMMYDKEFYYAYADTGEYNVTLYVINFCGDTATSTNTFYVQHDTTNKPSAYMSFNNYENWVNGWPIDTLNLCPGTEVSFSNDSWSGSPGTNYLWDFGDGTTTDTYDASHIFTMEGINEVRLIITNSCGGADTAYKWINVNSSTMPMTQLQNIPDTICPGEKVYFFDNEYDQANIYNIWYGDGSFDLDMQEIDSIIEVLSKHVYETAGSYDFIFTATNSCGNTDTLAGTIVVDGSGNNAPFYYVMNSTMSDGGNPDAGAFPDFSQSVTGLEHTFTSTVEFPEWVPGVSDTVYMVYWYGGSDIFQGPDGPGQPAGLVIQDGFGDVNGYVPVEGNDSVIIGAVWWCNGEIAGEPQAISISGPFALTEGGSTNTGVMQMSGWDGMCIDNYNPESGCPGDNVLFMSLGGVNYEWHMYDGTIIDSSMAMYTFPTPGLYDNYVVISNGCGGTDTIHSIADIGDYNVPDAYFGFNGWVCAYDPVNFYADQGNDFGNVDFLWDFGDGTYSTEESPVHYYTTGGEFKIIFTVSNGCGSNSDTNYIYVNQPEVNATILNGCNGENNGVIDVTVSNAWSPVSYEWSTGESSPTLSGLAPGDYTITVTDGGGCMNIKTFTIETPLLFEVEAVPYSVSCNGGADGYATINYINGEAPYYYFWSNGLVNQNLSLVSAGTYDLTVVDKNGCTAFASADITEPDVLSGSYSSGDLVCYNDNTGWISYSATGGNSPYNFEWSEGLFGGNINGLHEGDYFLTLTDDNGCTYEDTVYIGQPTEIIFIESVTDATCGSSDGSIALSITGGVTPYGFAWSNGETTQDISSLDASYYTLTLTDGQGCERIESWSVLNPGAPSISVDLVTGTTCNGSSDGEISISITGGSTPYNIQWNIGSTDEIITSLSAGDYGVTVTDALNCVVFNPVISVTEPDVLELDLLGTNISCFGLSDGSIDTINTMVIGGTEPYSMVFSNPTLDNLSAGWYYMEITDFNGCFTEDSVEIIQPDELVLELFGIDASCYGYADGSLDTINSYLYGGTPPYSFNFSYYTLWELPKGMYYLEVTDENNCYVIDSMLINEPDSLHLSIVTNDASCGTCSTGSIDLAPSGGTMPYSYDWSNGATTEDISSLLPDDYSVLFTDANGCEYFAVVTVDFIDNIDGSPIASKFNVYPNPTNTGIFNVESAEIDAATVLRIFDMSGRAVKEVHSEGNNTLRVDAQGLSTGSYIIQIVNGGASVSGRIIIDKR